MFHAVCGELCSELLSGVRSARYCSEQFIQQVDAAIALGNRQLNVHLIFVVVENKEIVNILLIVGTF